MATVKKTQFRARQFGGAAGAYGNTTTLAYTLLTSALGGVVGADSTAALAIADVVDLGPLPVGMRLDDSFIVISTGMTTAVTASLGFKYEDEVDDTNVPQDAAYFGSGVVMSAAARLRNASSKALVSLPKPARLILTIAGAANAKISKIDFVIQGELNGPN
jgi:hypothetical protein